MNEGKSMSLAQFKHPWTRILGHRDSCNLFGREDRCGSRTFIVLLEKEPLWTHTKKGLSYEDVVEQNFQTKK